MDDRAFDELTKRFGAGLSRRRLIRGMLGLGAVAAGSLSPQRTDARSIGTRPTIPPAPPPPAPATTTMPPQATTTPDPCTGFHCGLECCETEAQCCDRECCTPGDECLTHYFPEGEFVEEEVCCPAQRVCDHRCCDGVCFDPNPLSPLPQSEKRCCPEGGQTCAGWGDYASVQRCCEGNQPDCCVREDGEPVCIDAASQCCLDRECPPDPLACLDGLCARSSQTCVLTTSINCQQGERCCLGGDNVCCPAGQECCGEGETTTCCGSGFVCCGNACIDPLTQCCSNADCSSEFGFDDDCVECSATTRTCVARNEGVLCGGSQCAVCQNRHCMDSDAECASPDTCTPAQCANGVCNQQSVCPDTTPVCCGTSAQDCVDLQSDELNCGACGNPCQDGFVCEQGQCVCDDDDDCPDIDACTPGSCEAGMCLTESACGGGDLCCGTGEGAGCCSAAECIAGSCCTDSGEEVCGDVCCRAQCCHNQLGDVCVPSGEQCCDNDADCQNLDRCIVDTGQQLLHDTYTCTGGWCVSSTTVCNDGNACTQNTCTAAGGCAFPALSCNDDNPCTTDSCNASTGCLHSPVDEGTEVQGGICCGTPVTFRAGGNCCTFQDCLPAPPCSFTSCTNNQCVYQPTCSAPNPDCQTADCSTGDCVISTNCGGNPPVGVGQQCNFGCQCPSNAICSSDFFSDPATCRMGGSGNAVRSFCPTE